MRENRPSGLMRGGKQTVFGLRASQSVVSRLLYMSHEGFLRLFYGWIRPNAKFVNLRAQGAFLVSAERKNGVCKSITVFSEKGRLCRVLNPWPGRTLEVTEVLDNKQRTLNPEVKNESYGQLCGFKTEPGKSYAISPKEGLPKSILIANAALYRPVTASSSEWLPERLERSIYPGVPVWKPEQNWGPEKLTDGNRMNTGYGSRGWSSKHYDDPNHTESIQVDLGEVTPLREVTLWPLDHGDGFQVGPNDGYFDSRELDQSFDGFPVSYRILVSNDARQWNEVAKVDNYLYRPDYQDLNPMGAPRPVTSTLRQTVSGRYVKVEFTHLRKTRTTGKYAVMLAELEVIRARD